MRHVLHEIYVPIPTIHEKLWWCSKLTRGQSAVLTGQVILHWIQKLWEINIVDSGQHICCGNSAPTGLFRDVLRPVNVTQRIRDSCPPASRCNNTSADGKDAGDIRCGEIQCEHARRTSECLLGWLRELNVLRDHPSNDAL